MITRRAGYDPSLYLVTDTAMCAARGVVATVRAAVAGGVGMVQLRDPSASNAEFAQLGRALLDALRGTGVPLVVNDRVPVAAAIGADGAHVGQGDLDVAAARALLGPDVVLGLSVETPGQVRAALRGGADIDYLGAGPVWAQSTKPDAVVPCGPEVLGDIVAASPWPCVAIGGIDVARVAEVRASGVAGIAVVSAICAAPDPQAAAARLRSAWDDAVVAGTGHHPTPGCR